MESKDFITILLADPHSLFREAVKTILESEKDLVVVAEAGDGQKAVAEAQRVTPNVALLGMNLPNCNGVRATALIKSSLPECKVLVLTDEEDESALVESVEAGANGYLTKECPLAELIDATRAIHRGETLIPKGMLGALLARLIRQSREQDEAVRRASRLSKRERSVLALLVDGADNDGIAQALVISPQTARTHVQNVLAKLEVHSRLEAAAFARQNGLVGNLVGAGE